MNILKSYLSIASLVFIFGACSTENDPGPTGVIDGAWSLKNVSGGFAGINIDYDHKSVVWTFNQQIGILQVENLIDSTGPEDIHAKLNSGTYDFSIKSENDADVLYINNSKMGKVIVLGTTFYLDDEIAADGFMMEFESIDDRKSSG